MWALCGDVPSAHRRVRVVEEDWGLMACRLDDEADVLWLNCVGTYGVGSAGYWWARLASGAIVRLGHYILADLPLALESLLYVDDLLLASDSTKLI